MGALRVVTVAIVLVAGGIAAAHYGLLSPIAGFGLCAAGLAIGGIGATLVGVLGLRRTGGSLAGWLGLLGGVAMLAVCVRFGVAASSIPRIHDISTDVDDPPEFAQLPRGETLDYPDGGTDVPDLQQAAYPDLESIVVGADAQTAFEAARRIAEELGWTVTWAYREGGRIEAYDVTPLFRFVDDVAIRVRRDGEGARVDLRSVSRVGQSDLGANAARIRRFAAALRDDPALR